MGKRFVTFVEVIHQLVIYVTLLEHRACHKVSCVSTDRQRTHRNQLDSECAKQDTNHHHLIVARLHLCIAYASANRGGDLMLDTTKCCDYN